MDWNTNSYYMEYSIIVKIESGHSVSMCSFLDNFCINVPQDLDNIIIQEKPLYKIEENEYCFLYINCR